ncbi:MAG: B12-binding domain-containing radical SAM protein [Desulfobacterales bacterium]|nr:B12-binding domain-containing radical SAM protein [Desulfobacterales bacterium]
MKILLIQPPVRDFYFTKKRSIPYGLLTIAQALKDASINVSLLDCLATKKSKDIPWPNDFSYLKPFYGTKDTTPFSLFSTYTHYGYSYQHIRELIKRSGADVFGISSLFTAYANEAIEITKIIKDINKDHITIVGGHHPTTLPDEVLSEKSVDFIIRGEGEESFVNLACSLKEKKDFKNISGLGYKINKKLFINDKTEIKNPEHFKHPDLSLLNHKFYSRYKKGSAVIVSSRGCPMNCTYCCVTSQYSSYRRRPVKSVIDEIKAAVINYNVRFIDFEDENLTLEKNWFKELLSELKENFSSFDIEYRAMNGLYPPTLSADILSDMKNTGFKVLNLSLGTTSKTQLKIFGRPDVTESINSVISRANEHNLSVVSYIITGAPSQDSYETLDDIIFLSYLKTVLGVSVYYPAPGSKLYKDLKAENRLPISFDLYRSSSIPLGSDLKRQETVTVMRIGRIVNYLKSQKIAGINFQNSDSKESAIIRDFFRDSKIRGIDSNGEIFFHKTSSSLCEYFINNFDLSKLS